MRHSVITYQGYKAAISGMSIPDIGAYTVDASKYLSLFPELTCQQRQWGAYLFDYTRNRYLFADRLFLRIGGITEADIRAGWTSDGIIYGPDKAVQHGRIFGDQLHFFAKRRIPAADYGRYLTRTHYRIMLSDGTLRTILQERIFVRVSNDGKPLLALGFVTDITELRRGDGILSSIVCEGKVVKSKLYSQHEGSPLTRSEIEVLKMYCDGLTAQQIAGISSRSFRTVENQLQSVRNKAGVHAAPRLALWARDRGYV